MENEKGKKEREKEESFLFHVAELLEEEKFLTPSEKAGLLQKIRREAI